MDFQINITMRKSGSCRVQTFILEAETTKELFEKIDYVIGFYGDTLDNITISQIEKLERINNELGNFKRKSDK